MISSTASARDEKAFVWLMFEPPTEVETWDDSKVFTVNGLTDNGDITGMVLFNGEGPTRGYAFTIDGFCQEWPLLPPNYPTTIMDMNNDRTIVGWTYADTGRRWVYSSGYTTPGSSDTFEDDQVWGIDDHDNMVGLTDTEAPEAWYAEWSGWGAFNPLSGGTATAALGLNNNVASPDAVGISTDDEDAEQAVVWPAGSLDATLLGPGTPPPYLAYRVNDDEVIIGSRWDSGISKHRFLVWVPDGEGGWEDAVDTGVQSPNTGTAGAINNHNEFVIFRTLFYFDTGGTMHSVDIGDLVEIPGAIVQSGLRFEGINDNGWMVGYASVNPNDANDRRAIILVPRDDNNDDIPDYREIIDDPDLDIVNGNWVLDWSELTRPGIFDVGSGSTNNLNRQVDNSHAVRTIRKQNGIHDMLYDAEVCAGETELMNRWGFNENGYSDRQKEIVVTIRTQRPGEGNEKDDYIPPLTTSGTELGQDDILADLELFAYLYADYIDYVQVGNEIWAGAGRYFIEDGVECTGGGSYSGGYLSEAGSCLPNVSAAVFAWLGKEVDALRRGSALAGRPLRIIGPGTSFNTILNASGAAPGPPFDPGDDDDPEDDPASSSYFIQQWIVFCNQRAIPIDVHYHFFDVDDANDAADDIESGGLNGTAWPIPDLLATLEYGPVPSHDNDGQTDDWWSGSDQGKVNTEFFYDGNTGNNPTSTWNLWVENWLSNDQMADLPTDFLETQFADLQSRGYRLIMYSSGNQPGSAPDAQVFDLSAIVPTKLEAGISFGLSPWASVFEAAAADLATALGGVNFNPHPNACPDICPEE